MLRVPASRPIRASSGTLWPNLEARKGRLRLLAAQLKAPLTTFSRSAGAFSAAAGAGVPGVQQVAQTAAVGHVAYCRANKPGQRSAIVCNFTLADSVREHASRCLPQRDSVFCCCIWHTCICLTWSAGCTKRPRPQSLMQSGVKRCRIAN